MAKLVYIVSAGHSGSTLLDIVIGTIPRVISTGECTYLPWQIFRRGESDPNAAKEDVCSCLKSFYECPEWNSVINYLNNRLGFDLYKDPYKFRITLLKPYQYNGKQQSLDRLILGLYVRCIQRKYLRFVSHLLGLSCKNIVKNNWLLFDAIGKVRGAEYVVDSSKDFSRMHLLHSMRKSDVSLILLIRDVRGVVASAVKRGEDPLEAAQAWKFFYICVVKALRWINDLPIIKVRYENLCENPIKQRKIIAKFLGLPDPGEQMSINTHDHHLVAGNPMRYKGNIDIKCDKYWHKALDKKLCLKLQCYNKDLADMMGKLPFKEKLLRNHS